MLSKHSLRAQSHRTESIRDRVKRYFSGVHQDASPKEKYAQLLCPVDTPEGAETEIEERQTDPRTESVDVEPWLGWREFVVRKKVYESTDRSICSFYLEPFDGKPIPVYKPGQYLTVRVDQVAGTFKPVVRCYSLSRSPRSDAFRISIKKVAPPKDLPNKPPGLCSNHFHNEIEEGCIIACKAPHGEFFMPDDQPPTRPAVLLAAGIGATPIMAMLEVYVDQLKQQGWSQPVVVFYGAMNGEQIVFNDRLMALAEHPLVSVYRCFSRPGETDQLNRDYEVKSRVNAQVIADALDDLDCDYYLCGPGGMIQNIYDGLTKLGVEPDSLHFEHFGPSSLAKTADDKAPSVEFPVTCSESDETVTWSSRHASLLDVLMQQDIDYGCRVGQCGACVTRIEAGTVAYPQKRPAKALGTCTK